MSIEKMTPRNARRTFRTIVIASRDSNISALMDRAFGANRMAKNTTGRSQEAAYRAKSAAISQLLIKDAARVNWVQLSPEPLIGVDFELGGRLHVKPALLCPEAQSAILRQIQQVCVRGMQ
jgi:hypothetical protein